MTPSPSGATAQLAICLALLATGCCPCARHGVLLRGDWSLELNRVPWLASRSLSERDCTESCSAHDGTVVVNDSCGIDADKYDQAVSRARQSRQRVCRADNPGPLLVQPGCQAPSRFHPVPTQPVFGNPAPSAATAAPLPPNDRLDPNPSQSDAPDQGMAPSGEKAEVIPLPGTSENSTPSNPRESRLIWVFSSSEADRQSEQDPVPVAHRPVARK